MVNACRTLLLNQPASGAPDASYPGEEYVPPSFQSRPLPPLLAQARQLLFGAGPDRAYLNYRLRELMGLAHASELEGHVLALDPRVTYLPFNDDLFKLAAAGAVVTTVIDTGQQLSFVGGRQAVPSGNQLRFSWRLTVLDAATYLLVYDDGTGRLVSNVRPYATDSGLSGVVLLTGSNLAVRFTAGTGSTWQIDALARPAQRLPALIADVEQGLTDDMADAVFGPAGTGEPYKTFRNCWERHDQFPYRAGGLALALAYRTHDLGG